MGRTTCFGLLPVALVLAGCRNTLYYYQTDKFSLGVETRPDSTQPVSGTFGFKQRVAMVVPSKDGKKVFNRDPQAEALTLISYFDFDLDDQKWTLLDPITVESALITGKAASGLDAAQAQAVFKAISTADLGALGAKWSTISLIYSHVQLNASLQTPEVQRALTGVELHAEAALRGATEFSSYARAVDAAGLARLTMTPYLRATTGTWFERCIEYRAALERAVEELRSWSSLDRPASNYTLRFPGAGADVPASDSVARVLAIELQRLEKELGDFERTLGTSSAVFDLVEAYHAQLR